MWLSDICKYKCSNAKVLPWRFLMKISPFTAVEFRLCNKDKIRYDKKTLFEFGFWITINTSSQELFTEYKPKLTYSLIYYSY